MYTKWYISYFFVCNAFVTHHMLKYIWKLSMLKDIDASVFRYLNMRLYFRKILKMNQNNINPKLRRTYENEF